MLRQWRSLPFRLPWKSPKNVGRKEANPFHDVSLERRETCFARRHEAKPSARQNARAALVDKESDVSQGAVF